MHLKFINMLKNISLPKTFKTYKQYNDEYFIQATYTGNINIIL